MARPEAAAEKVDDESQEGPPRHGAPEEARDGEEGPREGAQTAPRQIDGRNFEDGEEGQDVGNDDDEVGDRQAEDRGEVLPQRGAAGAVAANLRHGVLREDVDADEDDEDAADDAQQGAVLLNLVLEHRIEEEGDHRHERIGAGDADARDDTRAAALREGPLNAEDGHGADRDRGGDTHQNAAEKDLYVCQRRHRRFDSVVSVRGKVGPERRQTSARTGPLAKIRISRGQKQIYLHFAEAANLRRSQRYEEFVRLRHSFGK